MDAAAQIETVPLRELSDRDREIIAFERQWWKYAGAKEQAIRELFDMSATRCGKEGMWAAQPIKGALEQGQRPACLSRHPAYRSGICTRGGRVLIIGLALSP